MFSARRLTWMTCAYNDKMGLFIGSAKDGSIRDKIDSTLAEGIAVGTDGSTYVGETVTGQRLEDRIRALPGVMHVGAVNILPLGGSYSCDGFDVDGHPSEQGKQPCAEARSITPDYFGAMGIPLVRGRTFTRQDVERSQPVVIRRVVTPRSTCDRAWGRACETASGPACAHRAA